MKTLTSGFSEIVSQRPNFSSFPRLHAQRVSVRRRDATFPPTTIPPNRSAIPRRCVCVPAAESQVSCKTTEAAEGERVRVRVRFEIERECKYGEQMKIVGDAGVLGGWDPRMALPLEWSEGHVWTVDLEMPAGSLLHYKFVVAGCDGAVLWQPGDDRVLEICGPERSLLVVDDWEDSALHAVTEDASHAIPRALALVADDVEARPSAESLGNDVVGEAVLVPGLPAVSASENEYVSVQSEPAEEELPAHFAEAEAIKETDEEEEEEEEEEEDEDEERKQEGGEEAEERECTGRSRRASIFENDVQWSQNAIHRILNGFGMW